MEYRKSEIIEIADSLLTWMGERRFAGWDLHDGLNSPFLRPLPKINRWIGVAALQTVKRSQINLRPLLRVPKTVNAKGVGLILSASVVRYRLWGAYRDRERALSLGEWLVRNQTPGYSGACWGYPFDWANRSFFAPKGTPTIVNTGFIGHAFLDLYEMDQDDRWLQLAISACDFIEKDLNRTQAENGFSFSYTPLDRAVTHNANLIGASLLARTAKLSSRNDLIALAWESARFSVYAQRENGSWPYGEAENQRWIDSFHTGYNLLALQQIADALGINKKKEKVDMMFALEKGFDFYIRNFFLQDGTVKFYHDIKNPLDSHAFAHAVICLVRLSELFDISSELVKKIVSKMIFLFWSGKGHFYYKKNNFGTVKTPFMRWTQAWIFLALFSYLDFIS